MYDGRAHRCVNESLDLLDGVVRRGAATGDGQNVEAVGLPKGPMTATNSGAARAEAPRPFRRPLEKDRGNTISAMRPWEAEGVSRATWYRWQKAKP